MKKRASFTAAEAAAARRLFWDHATFKVLRQAADAVRAGKALEHAADREFVANVLDARAEVEWRRIVGMSGVKIGALVADYLTRCKRGVSLPEAARWALDGHEGFGKNDVAAVVKATKRLRSDERKARRQGQRKG